MRLSYISFDMKEMPMDFRGVYIMPVYKVTSMKVTREVLVC